MMNENEEKLYEMAENELANEPRRGLLARIVERWGSLSGELKRSVLRVVG